MWRWSSSSWEKKKDDDFETKLSEYDEAIRKSEIALSAMRLRERQALFSWLYYSLPSYLVILLVYFKFMHPEGDSWEVWLIKSTPVMVGPLIIFFVRRLISFSFGRWKNYEEMNLENLRSRQKAMVEELKKKTKFYATKELIERYETPGKAKDSQRKLDPLPGLPKSDGSTSTPSNSAGLVSRKLLQDDSKSTLIAPNTASIAAPMPLRPPSYMSEEFNALSTPIPLINHSDLVLHQTVRQAPPGRRNWYDKIVDAIVGDEESPNSRYALICRQCYTHNGLVLPDEYSTIKYKCTRCSFLNENHYSRPTTTNINSQGNKSDGRMSLLSQSLGKKSADEYSNTKTKKEEEEIHEREIEEEECMDNSVT